MKTITTFFIISFSLLLQSCVTTNPHNLTNSGSSNRSQRIAGATIGNIPDRPLDINAQPQVNFEITSSQLINSYRQLVSITPQGGEYGKEVQRLADLELEASMDHKLSDDPAQVELGKQQSLQAIQRYEEYLESYPDRADNDLILYQLSRAHALENNPEKAQQVMQKLVTAYPGSGHIEEVQFRLGETFFVQADYPKAEKAYGVVVKNYPNSLYYEKSLYKYGWAQFKQNQNKNAIGSYIKLLDLKQQQQAFDEFKLADSLSRAEKELIDDVLRVVSLSFSYLPGKQPVSSYFNKAGNRPYEPLLYSKLADLYLSKDRITDASDVYLAYGDNHPFSSFTPVFHGLAIDTLKKSGFVSLLLPEKESYVKKYNKGSAFWNQQTPADQAKLQPILTVQMFDIATHYHATARASKKAADFKKTASWYQRYLESFPQDEKAAEINFLLAESRFDAKQYQQAITEYEKTAYQYPTHKNSAEAGYAALLAYNNLYKTSPKDKKPVIEELLINSSLRFTNQFPNDKHMPDVLLKTAEQYFDLKKYVLAQTTAERLVNNPQILPKHKHNAWILIAHSSFELANYAQAEKAYSQVLTGLTKKAKNYKSMQEQLATSIYKQGEAERLQGNHQLAASQFLRVGTTVPGSPSRVIADYDAATEYMSIEQWPVAISLLETFRKIYPKQKKWRPGVSQKLALAYNNSGNHAKAADEMMNLIKLTPQKGQKDLLWQAAELYNQAGDEKKAISAYKTYINKYPNPISRSIELRYKIAQNYASQNDTKRRYYWLNEIVKTDAKGKKQRTDRTRYLAAIASLELITPLHKKYSQVKLTTPLKKSLNSKKKLMKQAIDAYTKAAKFQVEEVTTAATFNIAEIYREFASALLNSQRPGKLNAEELEEYNYLLEDQAFPFEEKAIKIHQSNLARIPKGSFDDSIKNSLQALAKLLPFRYAKTEMTDNHAE